MRHRISAPAAHLSLTPSPLPASARHTRSSTRRRSCHRSPLCSMSRRTVVVLWPRRTIQMVTTEFPAPLRDTVHITGSGPHPGQGASNTDLRLAPTPPGPHDDRVKLTPQPVSSHLTIVTVHHGIPPIVGHVHMCRIIGAARGSNESAYDRETANIVACAAPSGPDPDPTSCGS